MDEFLDILGVVIACEGEALRLWAWGTNPKTVKLRRFGPNSFIRHPLYVGNFLIGLGLLIVFNAATAYLVVLPFLALLYWSVAAEEEARLGEKWGVTYAEYRAKVPRFVPWRGRELEENQRSSFDWKQALCKERESICGFLAGAMVLEAYEDFVTYGFQKAQGEIFFFLLLSLLLGLFSFHLYLQKTEKMEETR